MSVRLGNAVLLNKMSRTHVGMTPFSLKETILTTDLTALNQVLLARLPNNFVAIQNIVGALVVRHALLDTDATESLIYSIGISGADGVLTTTLFNSIVMGDAAATLSMAQNGASPDWFISTLEEQYLTFDVEVVAATPAEGLIELGGIYSAGLDIVGP